ncbi:MAG: ABC transporter permease subunit [Gallionellaceae bacterium]
MIRLIALKELRSLCVLPTTWMLLGGFQFVFAWFFLVRLDAFLQVQNQLAQIASAPGATQAVAVPLYDTAALILMMLTPLFTMRLFAEERRNQTLVLLMAAPISGAQIVLGKFIGLMLFLLFIIAGCTLMLLTLATGTQLDFGLLLGNALGLLLLAASYAAIGLYISSLTAQPLLAASAALAVLFGSWLMESSAAGDDNPVRAFAPTAHFRSFTHGLLNSADMVYFLVICAAFLWLTIKRLHSSRICS